MVAENATDNTWEAASDKQHRAWKSQNKIHTVAKKMQAEFISFLRSRHSHQAEDTSQLLAEFLTQKSDKDSALYKTYTEYLQQITGKNTEDIQFQDITALPISENWILSEALATWHQEHLEIKKQEHIFAIREQHYSNAIQNSNNSTLYDKREQRYKNTFNKTKKQEWLHSWQLFTTLTSFVEEFFASCTKQEQSLVAYHFKNNNSYPTHASYLTVFKSLWFDISDKKVASNLLKKTQKQVHSLEYFMAKITQVELLAWWIIQREKEKQIKEKTLATITHNTIHTELFRNFPEKKFLATTAARQEEIALQEALKQVWDAEEKENIIKQHNSKMLDLYFSRVLTQIDQESNEKVLIQLLQVLKKNTSPNTQALIELEKAITTYLQEQYLRENYDDAIISKQLIHYGIDARNSSAFKSFWLSFYDSSQKKTIFDYRDFSSVPVQHHPLTLVFKDKKIINHLDSIESIDDLDKLFSFTYTIDLIASDPTMAAIFDPSIAWWVLVDDNHSIITEDNRTDESIYQGNSRLVLNKKEKLHIYNTQTQDSYSGTWYLETDDTEEDTVESSIIISTEDWSYNIPLSIDQKGNIALWEEWVVVPQQSRTILLWADAKHPWLWQWLLHESLLRHAITMQHTHVLPEQDNIVNQKPSLANESENDILGRLVEDNNEENQSDHTNNPTENNSREKNRDFFKGYSFGRTEDIPEGLKARYPWKIINAWIADGRVFFNSDYIEQFVKTKWGNLHITKTPDWHYLFDGIPLLDRYFGKHLNDTKEERKLHTVLKKQLFTELIRLRRHEIAHRFFRFHGLDESLPEGKQLRVKSITGEEILLSNEELCEIADERSNPWQHDANGSYVIIHRGWQQHHISIEVLEKQIQEHIGEASFSFSSIKWLDAKQFDNYMNDTVLRENRSEANTAETAVTNPASTSVDAEGIAYASTNPNPTVLRNQHTRIQQQLERRIDTLSEQAQNGNPQARVNLEQAELAWARMNRAYRNAETDPVTLQQAQQQAQRIINSQWNNTNNQTSSNSNVTTNTGWNYNRQGWNRQENTASSRQTTTNPTPPWTARDITNNNSESVTNTQEEDMSLQERDDRRKKFDRLFSEFKGDQQAKAEKWTVLFLKDDASDLPWQGHNRAKYKIVDIDEENDSLIFELVGATEKEVGEERKVRPLVRDESTINLLKRAWRNDIYKFSWKSNRPYFFDQAKEALPPAWKDIKWLSKEITVDWKKKTGTVSHVGKIKQQIANEKVKQEIYSVERWSNSVKVSTVVGTDKDAKLRTHTMDYDSFLLFCKSKELDPLTSEEVTRSWGKLDPSKVTQEDVPWYNKLVSIWSIVKSIQKIPEIIKQKTEEEQELQQVYAETWLSGILPGTSLFYLDEVKNDLGWTDGAIYKRIMKYKSDLTGGGEKSDVHDNPISEGIRDSIFENIGTSRKYKYKAAAALLYALEKWSAYFRKLAPYMGKDGWGMWVKVLLWKTAHEEFLKEKQKKIDELKSAGVDNDNLNDDIAKYELDFIARAMQWESGEKFRWSKVGRDIEDHRDKLYGGAESIDPSGIAKKWNFKYMYEAFMGWGISANNPRTLFSALKAMEWAVGSSEDYDMFYMCILTLFASGVVHILPTDYIDKLKGIGRSKGIPIALFASDPHASGKVVGILDHIAKNAGKWSFSEKMKKKGIDFYDISASNYAEDVDGKEKFKLLNGAFIDRWQDTGRDIIDAFNFKNDYLINIPANTSEKKKQDINDYLWEKGMFWSYKWYQEKMDIDPQSPFLSEGLINVSEWWFQSYVVQINDSTGRLQDERARTLWQDFANILSNMETQINTAPNEAQKVILTKILYQKFIKNFSRYFNQWSVEQKFEEMQQNQRRWKKTSFSKWFSEFIIEKMLWEEEQWNQQWLRRSITDPDVRNTMISYAEILWNSLDKLSTSGRHAVLWTSAPIIQMNQKQQPLAQAA